MEKAIRQTVPAKIDIGPVYNFDPQKRQAYQGNFRPEERELVFDIDMNDYNDVRRQVLGGVRSCLPGSPRVADVPDCLLQLLQRGGRVRPLLAADDSSDAHHRRLPAARLWVRAHLLGLLGQAWDPRMVRPRPASAARPLRGIESPPRLCRVCDQRARRLTEEQRGAIVEYLKVFMGHEGGKVALKLRGSRFHPAISRALRRAEEVFEQRLLPEQHLLENLEACERMLAYLPEGADDLRDEVRDRWRRTTDKEMDLNQARWEELRRTVEKHERKNKPGAPVRVSWTEISARIMFAHSYPRLDVEVSKHLNHLLKAPFCVHPKTGRVCVPIDPEVADDFDPLTSAPTLKDLLLQLDAAEAAEGKEAWEQTDMREAVETFRRCFLRSALKAEKEGQRGKKGDGKLDW